MWAGDIVIVGRKGSGKSTLLGDWVAAMPGGVIVRDPTDSFPLRRGWVKVTMQSDLGALRGCVSAGGKAVLYTGPCDSRLMKRQVSFLVSLAQDTGCSLAFDEGHEQAPLSGPLDPVADLIRRGRHYGPPRGQGHVGSSFAFCTPAPQELSKSPMHAGATVYLFDSPFSQPWMQRYGIPQGTLERLAGAPPHSYVRIREGRAEGPFRGPAGLVFSPAAD